MLASLWNFLRRLGLETYLVDTIPKALPPRFVTRAFLQPLISACKDLKMAIRLKALYQDLYMPQFELWEHIWFPANWDEHWPDRDVHGPVELQKRVDETRHMLTDLSFVIEVGPFLDGDLMAARWIGTGATKERPIRFTGNDILRFSGGRFTEYWTGTSAG